MKARAARIAVCVLGLVAAAGWAWSQEVEITQQSKFRVWYSSPDVRIELGYHWADRHLGDDWLVLKVSIAGSSGGVTAVERGAVHMRTPAGEVLDLPTQTEFREGMNDFRMALQRDNAWEPASSRFEASLRRAEEWFFSPPGFYFHRDTIYPSNFQYCTGPMVFRVPGGVQPGEWTLTIDLEESKVRLPFVLGRDG